MEGAVAQFVKIGIAEAKAKETVKNTQVTTTLLEIIKEAKCEGGCDKSIGMLFYQLATKLLKDKVSFRPQIIQWILEKKVTNNNIDALITYVNKHTDLTTETIISECGVGVVVTKEQIAAGVKRLIESKKAELIEKRYTIENQLIKEAKDTVKWADGKLLNEELTKQLKELLGEKTKEDSKKKAQKKSDPKKDEKKEDKEEKKTGIPKQKNVDSGVKLSLPQDNKQKTPEILAEHLKRTGGIFVTRFPPEPNGYLHIGHAKSMFLNFGYAEKTGGKCYMRFDDTNPEKETHEFISTIEETVKWLGHTPCAVTYSSQYFDRIYDCAIELIKRGKAYVCHQTAEQISASREKQEPSPWRNRSVEENLKLFKWMCQGRYAEGEATLRMKMDITSPNPCMWDLVAYRIKYFPHPVTGDKLCCYPSYDFVHCLVDSFEDITHSMCTLEFLPRRESYFWLLDALDMYKPVVWEFNRLNITYTVMSKRKLLALVTKKYVRGWDDPRMPTIMGFKRKGYSANAINNFCRAVGVTTNTTVYIDYEVLEQHCRDDMEIRCKRAMCVPDPLKVVLTNVPDDYCIEVVRPNHPITEEMGTNTVHLRKVIYVDRNDFKEEDKRGFWGLAPNKVVGLRYSGNICCEKYDKDETGKVTCLYCRFDIDKKEKPKGHIQWVSSGVNCSTPIVAELRLYSTLFTVPKPETDDWEKLINKDSLVIVNGYVDESLAHTKPGDSYQFERVGFFCTDTDSKEGALVFNRTVELKVSKEKQQL
ncbi:glutaminyl-tRNA synthetase, putative [Entamoeba invadens IP1]|uniref:glutaminyl-tRNA synthetase, putative n=1 Tax=Entamoeba invadens IP1 TaxID=370355 RepID=UPI0002C3D55B|nr:glutaminyl-tRNA synthetase, putative [Entamoeba invadens IP1]ELP85004.1 glutaminyl-tRNA synthetase, putative [Entamoeba invadens IP1]|eukprot:XP_004184350.1 glutaminyl-tRNA synthetase, putative [Entamoeba invadens IP1]